MRDEVRRVTRELGISALFVTHNQDEGLSISDSVAIMNNGSSRQIGNERGMDTAWRIHPCVSWGAKRLDRVSSLDRFRRHTVISK